LGPNIRKELHRCNWPASIKERLWGEAAHKGGVSRRKQGIRHCTGRRPSLQAHRSQLPLIPGKGNLIVPARSDLRVVLSSSDILSPCHAVCRGTGWINLILSSSFLSTRQAISLPGRQDHHSRVPQASVSCQIPGELPQGLKALAERLEDRHHGLDEYRDTSRSPDHWLFFGSPCYGCGTARYLGVALDTRLSWCSHIETFRNKTDQGLAFLHSLFNRMSGLSIRNGVMLYK
jgi:hypothetical protein